MRPRVLVIDRMEDRAEEIARALGERGFDSLTVDDGLAALRLMKEERPPLAVIGEVSRHLGQVELCRALRKAAAGLVGIAVVLTRDSALLRSRLIEVGADRLLTAEAEGPLANRLAEELRRLHQGEGGNTGTGEATSASPAAR